MESFEATLPKELTGKHYPYPAALFADWDRIMRFEGSDDIHVPIPVSEDEKPSLMAKYAVARSLRLNCRAERLVKIARGEAGSSFMNSIIRVKNSLTYGDLERGDVELKADEMGVYEIIWPFDPEKMSKASEAEQQLAENLVAA